MSGRPGENPKVDSTLMTKTTLAKLQKDEFEVHTRSLRNGCKFYQDPDIIQQFKRPKSKLGENQSQEQDHDLSVGAKSQRRTKNMQVQDKQVKIGVKVIKSIMKPSKQVNKKTKKIQIQNFENQPKNQTKKARLPPIKSKKIQKRGEANQEKKALKRNKGQQVAEFSDSFETPKYRKKTNVESLTNTTKISSEMALKQKFEVNFENYLNELHGKINSSQRGHTDGATSLTSASRQHPFKMSYNDYIKQEMAKQESSKSVGGGQTAQRNGQDNFKFGFLDTQLDDDHGHGVQSAVVTTKRTEHHDLSHNFNSQRSASPSSLERQKRAQELIENINKINLEQIQQSSKPKKPCKKIKASKMTLAQQIPTSNEQVQLKNKTFKVYEEDELNWPVNSYLIQNIKEVPPKHGADKRITFEQDYNSDKEIVNSAKQKNKRDLKTAITSYLNQNKGCMSD